jgi:hypothetical protein
MSESVEREKLSGLARSIDALFAAPPARPQAHPTPIVPPPLPEAPNADAETSGSESAPAPAPRPRRPEMFPATQMIDVIKADVPLLQKDMSTSDLEAELSTPPAGPWTIDAEPDAIEPFQAELIEEPAADTPMTFADRAEGVFEGPREVVDDTSREDVTAEVAFPEAVEGLLAGQPGARDRVESLAVGLRERLALDPLADAVERLVRAAADPLDAWLLEVANAVINPAVASRLVQRMGQEQDKTRRTEYFTLCGRLGRIMANAVKGALTGATAPEVRRVYYDALISMGDASRPVIEKMIEDENRFLVRDAVAILGEIGGPRAVDLVTGALADTDSRVRAEALLALGKLGDAEAGQIVLGLLEDSDPNVRLAAAVAAGDLKVERAMRRMLQMLEVEHDEERCVRLLHAFGAMGDPGAVPAIEKHAIRSAFAKASTDVRIAAYRALHQIGTPHARELVQQALHDKEPGVRVALRDLSRAS